MHRYIVVKMVVIVYVEGEVCGGLRAVDIPHLQPSVVGYERPSQMVAPAAASSTYGYSTIILISSKTSLSILEIPKTI